MEEKLQQLKNRLNRVADLRSAESVLHWDMETYMPEGGSQARADQMGTLASLAHQYFVDEEVGKLLEDLAAYADQLDYDSDNASLIRVAQREYDKAIRVPQNLVEEISRTASLSQQNWQKARKENDFGLFLPWLEKTIDLQKQLAACFDPPDNLYDALVDVYEPGMTSTQIEAVFTPLKPKIIDLVKGITAHRDAVDDSVLHQHFDPDAQMAFGRQVVTRLGYSFERGRLDLTAHPFTIHFSRDDVRITTRVTADYMPSALMGTIHEAGHALYEQGTDPALYRLGLGRAGMMAEGTSMSVHESQSRFYENIIGRSHPFWHYFYPRLQEAFPEQLGNTDLEAFYRALNKSEPSLIRVEADEVTYGLHIMLRFDLENDLINDRVQVKNLPEEWNARMEEYLGITPPTDSDGVLQDVHWSSGYFGYFPDYLLGSIFAVQLWEQLKKDNPKVVAEIESGQFDSVLSWQRDKIHQHGKKFTFDELAQRVTGSTLLWEPYVDYLTTKYSEIYGL
ncbi:MAG: carboxypeptidase M32 [Anaerolineae bacterium]|nr:carboxypeptidase M32 [Anaerolineae bacterium]